VSPGEVADAQGNAIPKLQGNQTIYETEGGAIAENAGTSGTIVAGSKTIPIGALVNYVLGASGFGYTTSVTVSYIQLVTHNTGRPLVTVLGNGSGTVVAASFLMPIADSLDVVYVNDSASANNYTYSWQATSP
jgi:hypothetical protein